jgi:hypothetical protein
MKTIPLANKSTRTTGADEKKRTLNRFIHLHTGFGQVIFVIRCANSYYWSVEPANAPETKSRSGDCGESQHPSGAVGALALITLVASTGGAIKKRRLPYYL